LYPIRFPEAFKKKSHGVILYGPPGTGKSLLAEALANESNVNLVKLKASEWESKWVGETEKNIRGIFEGSPKASTFKKLGWAVENVRDLPFLLHLPWSTKNLQRGCIVTFSGALSGVPARTFLVTELTTALILPSKITCQITPLRGDKLPVQETRTEKKEKTQTPYQFLKED
jgi:hypothetical protein